MKNKDFSKSFSKEQLLFLLKNESKIEAIKYLFDNTDFNLKEAKDYVENFNENSSDLHFIKNEELSFKTNKDIDISKILELLEAHKKIEAISYVKNNANLGLAEAKDYVELIEDSCILNTENIEKLIKQPSETISNKESGRISKSSNGFKAIYEDNLGNRHNITPNHPKWTQFKRTMGNNDMVKEFESQFKEQPSPTSTQKSSLFIEENKGAKYIKTAIIIAVVLFIIYFAMNNF